MQRWPRSCCRPAIECLGQHPLMKDRFSYFPLAWKEACQHTLTQQWPLCSCGTPSPCQGEHPLTTFGFLHSSLGGLWHFFALPLFRCRTAIGKQAQALHPLLRFCTDCLETRQQPCIGLRPDYLSFPGRTWSSRTGSRGSTGPPSHAPGRILCQSWLWTPAHGGPRWHQCASLLALGLVETC